jgi:hypothetical protein
MISTMLKIQEATKDAIYDEQIMGLAGELCHMRNGLSDDEFALEIYKYSACLSAMTTTLVTHAILTENELNDMLEAIREFDELGEELN